MARLRLARSLSVSIFPVYGIACVLFSFGGQSARAQSGSSSSQGRAQSSSSAVQPADSVAEAARKTREAKKKNAAKAAKVVTEDDLKPSSPPAVAAQQPGAAPGGSAAEQTPALRPASSATGAATAPVEQSPADEPGKPNAPTMGGGLAVGAPPRSDSGAPSAKDVADAEAADRAAHKSPADSPVKDSDPADVKAAKAELAVAQADLESAKQELALEQDNFYRNPDYAQDAAGKAKIDGLQQQVAERQAEADKKKAKLTEVASKSSEAKP